LEDDIYFYTNFNKQIRRIEDEIKNLNITNFIISLEDSHLKYVKGSERLKDKYIYPKTRGRTTGAYLIDITSANNILSYLKSNKCSLHIGWFHNQCSENKVIQIYWCHPPVSTQGSINGRIKSLTGNNKVGYFRIMAYNVQKIYKKILYSIR
jgi:GR25 family glycosyltransferase involved in LPS biosynthesis